MLLAIDSGNTHIVFGLYKESRRLGQWRLKNEPQRPSDEYIVFLNQWLFMAGYSLKDIQDMVISSVVPDTLRNLKQMATHHFKQNPFIVGEPGVDLGIQMKIDHPETLGADRLVNAFGGFRQYGGPLLIIDFGTATTFDLVDAEGAYRGGLIAPGVNLSLEALYKAAAKLPPTAFARTDQVIGTNNTQAAMQAGCYWGYVGMIEGLHRRITQEFKELLKNPSTITVIATGGLASLFSQDLPIIDHVNENLTLDSLAEAYAWLTC